MIPYILHVTVITTICFLFYKLLLQKETFYRLNRWTLMGCLAVSFALPLLPVPQEWSWRGNFKETEVVSTLPEHAGTEPKQEFFEESRRPQMEPILPLENRSQGQPEKQDHRPGTAAGDVAGDAVLQPDHATAGLGASGAVSRPDHVNTSGGQQAPIGASRQAAVSSGSATTTLRSAASSGAQPSTTVERPTTVAVSGITDAGKEGSKATTGTPAEKNGAGTLAQFFSGAMLLLALQWLFYVYLFGVMLFGANFLLQLVILLYQSYSRPVINDGRFRIVEISGNRAPCSFGNTIFINPEKYDWETYNQILIHEKIHVSGRHTLDILLAEIALVIQWFNPFAWLYRREVENNLEFLTDANVLLDASIERSSYQLSLLRVSAPHLPFSLTNNYNQSLLKRRIVMMNSQRSSLHTVWKYFFLIPLLTGLMCALNKPAIALGAASTKLSMAHAPLFNLIAPIADTVKKPKNSAESGSAAPATSKSSSSSSSGEGSSTASTEGDGNSSRDGHGATVTIVSDADASAANLAMIDAYNQSFQTTVAVPIQLKGYHYDNNVSTVYTRDALDLSSVNLKLNAAVDAATQVNVQTDVRVDVPHYGFVDDSLVEGSWYAVSYGDRLSFELKAGDEDHNWSYTIHVDKGEINPFPGQGNVEFKLIREAGTMIFKGKFDGEEGFGHFHFTPDAAYFPALKQIGLEDIEERRQFGFFALNIKKDYVKMLVASGYPHITQHDLMSFASMHIDQAYIQYWHDEDLGDGDAADPRTLVRLKAMHIDRAYVDELKAAGYDHINLRDVESLKAQHIDKAYILSLGHGVNNQMIPVRELVSYKAMHIDSAYIQGLRKLGYDNLAMREITSLYALHVTPEYIQQLQGLGYKDLSSRDLGSLMSLHISPEYIKGFRDIGYTDLTARDLGNLKAMNITPEFIKGYQALGYKNLTPRTLGNLKATNVTPEFIKGFADLGYTDLNANDLASLKSMGITPDFVAGFQKLGFDRVPVHTLTSLKALGVTPEWVSKMKAQGFDSKDLNKYARLKTDFN